MAECCSVTDILDHIDALLSMMGDHEDTLYAPIDTVSQVRDEIALLASDLEDAA